MHKSKKIFNPIGNIVATLSYLNTQEQENIYFNWQYHSHPILNTQQQENIYFTWWYLSNPILKTQEQENIYFHWLYYKNRNSPILSTQEQENICFHWLYYKTRNNPILNTQEQEKYLPRMINVSTSESFLLHLQMIAADIMYTVLWLCLAQKVEKFKPYICTNMIENIVWEIRLLTYLKIQR